jgi:hypothetical protein
VHTFLLLAAFFGCWVGIQAQVPIRVQSEDGHDRAKVGDENSTDSDESLEDLDASVNASEKQAPCSTRPKKSSVCAVL